MGSVREGRTRRELLAAGVGAGTAAAALLVPEPALAAGAPAPESDTSWLHRLLSVELLLLFAYKYVLDSSMLRPRAQRALTPLRAHEQAHIRALRHQLSARGGIAPPPPPSIAEADRDLAHRDVVGRLGQLRGAHDALVLLLAVERVTVGVYFVALTKLRDPRLIVLAAEIMANDAQHEAVLGEQLDPGNVAMAVPYGLVQGRQGR
jgi:hypothetical protein